MSKYGNCPKCNADFDRIFRIDTREQEYFNKGLPLYCFSYLCGSVATCNHNPVDYAVINLKFQRQKPACKIIEQQRETLKLLEAVRKVTLDSSLSWQEKHIAIYKIIHDCSPLRIRKNR